MEKILVSHNRHWEKPYFGLYPRQVFQKLVRQLSARHIQVLQGIRRSGKSTVFKLMINHLTASEDPMEILYLNLEDPFFIKFSHSPEKLYEVIDTARKLTGKNIRYLFLDEVQAIDGWEKYVKTVYDNEVFEKIFITGSNAALLNGEFATLLTGRYLSSMVYPLSLSELLAIKNITTYVQMVRRKADVLALVDAMLRYGSFVEVFDSDEDLKRDIVSTYYDSILLKDCVSNNHIRDIKSFKELSYYLISNITATYSYSSLGKAVGIHDQSAREFVQYLQQAWLLFELRLFSWSVKEQQNNRKKPYVMDNGFINLSFAFSSNSGRLLENLVFSELCKAEKELYFYNKGFECDFIIKNADHSLAAIQVCHELTDRNEKREVGGLKKIDVQYPTVSKTIITYNQETTVDGIDVIPFWKFFGVQP
jgi:uncharacterized protein